MTPTPHRDHAADAAERWARALRSWALPAEILETAPESPYGFPTELFRSRAERAATREEPTPSVVRALEALPAGGTVLDVGVGGGAASLPLAGRAGELVGVDPSEELLEVFVRAAAVAGVPTRAVMGTWPEIAPAVPDTDVVVCHHVLYNVAELEPFVRALDDHAATRVVVELTDRHPLVWMNDLWDRFHSLPRPSGPTANDAADILRRLGLDPVLERREVTEHPGGFADRADAVALVRRRLCLRAERDPEVAEALGERLAEHDGLWSAGPESRLIVTMWWDVRHGG